MRRAKLLGSHEIQMLGVPLGSDEKVAAFVEGKLFGKLTSMVNRAFFLLRVSFTIVRATHFMRSTPLGQWREQAVKRGLTTQFARVLRQFSALPLLTSVTGGLV